MTCLGLLAWALASILTALLVGKMFAHCNRIPSAADVADAPTAHPSQAVVRRGGIGAPSLVPLNFWRSGA